MKIKLFYTLLIISSILSWVVWSFLFFYFLNPSSENFITEKSEIIKNTKTTNITDLQNEITQIIKNEWLSIVNIIIKKDLDLYKSDPWGFFREKVWSVERQIWWWSWFFITKEWLIITNKHVVQDKDAKYTVIDNMWNEFDASIVAYDKLTDLAVIKINNSKKEFNPLSFIEDEKEIQIWQFAIAVWNALWEFQNSVSFWVVSWKNRSIEAGWNGFSEQLTGLLQTDVAINPGNSWWPLLNLEWKVIWINTAIAWNSQWLWFSIPLTQKRINYIISSIEKYNEIKRPFLWINYISIDENVSKKLWINYTYGAFIPNDWENISPWSIADKSWISKWDIILEIDNIKITSQIPIPAIIQNKIPGDSISVKILKKDWSIKTINLKLWEI